MPSAVFCDDCEVVPALYLVTDLTNGDTRAYCAECFSKFCWMLSKALEDMINEDKSETVVENQDEEVVREITFPPESEEEERDVEENKAADNEK